MIKVIITGATGMVGEGVLHECLINANVEKVLLVNRKPSGNIHSKIDEIIVDNFLDLSKAESSFKEYNACFFCAGVSSVGMKEEDYKKITYDLTINFAETFIKQNPDSVFCYVSGAGTDTTEKGKLFWARVKGKTENDLMKLGFKNAFMFRPALIIPTKGMRHTYKMYRVLAPLLPLLNFLFPKYVVTLKDIGLAMINCAKSGNNKNILECLDIKHLAKQ